VRAPEALLKDAHLHDRGFWKQVEHPELGRSFVYPGEAAIYNGSAWAISRRAPLIGEHNVDIFCGELGLSRGELSVLVLRAALATGTSALPIRSNRCPARSGKPFLKGGQNG
jgi:crotonobetainyl-CoA:carnitine CoA-transferase CaiB-like acyl-CoA transferase